MSRYSPMQDYKGQLTPEEATCVHKALVVATWKVGDSPSAVANRAIQIHYQNLELLKLRSPRLTGDDAARCEISMENLRRQIVGLERRDAA